MPAAESRKEGGGEPMDVETAGTAAEGSGNAEEAETTEKEGGKKKVKGKEKEKEEDEVEDRWDLIGDPGRCDTCKKDNAECRVNLHRIEQVLALLESGTTYTKAPAGISCRR